MQYVIVGNGVAGVTAAFTLRERDPEARITIVSGETDYFFSRTALMYAFMDRMNRQDLEPYERQVFQKKRLELVRGWVTNLDAGSRRILLDSGRSLEYDALLLATGSSPRKPSWRGFDHRLDGLVHFVSMQDLDRCEKFAKTARRAVVAGGGLIGVELVECLRHFGIDVTFLVREPWYWPAALFEEEGAMVTAHIERHGVRVETKEEVDEVLSDGGRVRGIRTVSGFELACDLLGVSIGVEPSIDWLRGVSSPPDLGRGIRIDRAFRTSLPGVWAAGDCAEHDFVEQIWYSAKRHGELAARSILGERIDYHPPLFFNSAKFFEIEYTTVGRVTRLPDGAASWYRRIPGRDVSARIVHHEGAVIGFNMLGSRWDHSVLERWIHQRRTLEDVVGRLSEAQFDVEFGRVPLEVAR